MVIRLLKILLPQFDNLADNLADKILKVYGDFGIFSKLKSNLTAS